MNDIVLEVIRAIILLVTLGYLVMALGQRKQIANSGATLILLGFGLLLFGSILDVTDNFESLNDYVIIGDTETEAFLEKLVGYLGGSLIIAVGFVKWIPTLTNVKETEALAKQLALTNDRLEQDIEKRKIVEQALIAAKQEAEKANQAKTQFLSRMSHELRTPLNAIMGFSHLLDIRLNTDTEEQRALCIEQILQAGAHLLSLVEDILDVVKMDHGKLMITTETFALEPVIRQSLEMMQIEADKFNVSLSAEQTEILIKASPLRLKQVLINLLANGIKYNQAGGSVVVAIDQDQADWVTLVIKDNGVGMAADDLNSIFIPFTRLSYTEERQIDGVGVGLALCKFLVEQMGGQISVTSELGQGSEFSVTLPRADAVTEQPVSTVNGAKPAIVNKATSTTVLYVDDDPASCLLLGEYLRAHPSVALHVVNSGEAGISKAGSCEPQLILLDINLPDMGGIAVLQQFRQLPQFDNAVIIALSADATEENIDDALAAGFNQYLTKPVDFERLMLIINEL